MILLHFSKSQYLQLWNWNDNIALLALQQVFNETMYNLTQWSRKASVPLFFFSPIEKHFILIIAVCTCQSQTPNLSLSPTFPPANHKFIL